MEAIGFIFTGVLGTLLHFLFDWTGGNVVVGLFSAVNESIWEHMKLLFYPMLLWALLRWRKDGGGCYWWRKLLSILLGLTLIPVLYYTYTGLLGVNADWFNVTIFFLAAGVAFYLEYRLEKRLRSCPDQKWAVVALVGIAVLFTVFTFWTPQIPFFQDPITGSYGL